MSIDPSNITAEQFAEMVANAENDQQIEEAIRMVGTEQTLDRIFQGFQDAFIPEKAQGVEAEVQFTISDAGTEHMYTVAISNGNCATNRGSSDNAKTTLTTDLVSFVKLITGQAEGVQLFMTRKLQVSGDLMFAQRIMTFFDRPKPS